MKRIISTILSVVMVLMLGTVAFAATDGKALNDTLKSINGTEYTKIEQEQFAIANSSSNGSEGTNTLYYSGISVSSADLSETTVSWLDWYNSLDSDEQLAINYVPEELSSLSANSARLNSTDVLLSRSGAPVYNPSYWNDSSRIKKANCYAYSMDVICTTEMKLQPGQLAGQQFQYLTKASIYAAAQADGSYLGNGRSIVETTASSTPGSNQFKVALVIAPGVDYHWYILNSNGRWSHKRGWTEVTDVDASGNYIYDPATCDRNYSGANYSQFCGYFMVTRT